MEWTASAARAWFARGATLVVAGVWLSSSGCYTALQRMPEGTSFRGGVHSTADVRFLRDLTWVDAQGERHVEQQIFDAAFELIAGAERFVLVDMFLWNDFQGDVPEETRALCSELADALIARKRERPGIEMVVISDPVNTVYGGVIAEHFAALEEAGIPVVLTRLTELRDSNPTWSGVWRLLVRPFGNSPRWGLLPSPFGDDRVTLRSYLALLNMKANHRKLVIADVGDGYSAIVTSANPHDGSSAHGNVGVQFGGPAVADLLETEKAVLRFSEAPVTGFEIEAPPEEGEIRVQVLTEGRIRQWLLKRIGAARAGDRIDLAVFYLADSDVIEALVAAHQRGASVRALLDPNKDAFGYEKNGIPNRPVATFLQQEEVPVRWCDTHGEQCHAKMLLVRRRDGEAYLLAGSANFTRRNLQDLNLETSVALSGPAEAGALADAAAYFEQVWGNESGRRFSVDYPAYADESPGKRLLKQIEEEWGLSSF